jgi:hypothetical protein
MDAPGTRNWTKLSYPGDPTKAITVCDAINFIDVYLDPGLFVPREMVHRSGFTRRPSPTAKRPVWDPALDSHQKTRDRINRLAHLKMPGTLRVVRRSWARFFSWITMTAAGKSTPMTRVRRSSPVRAPSLGRRGGQWIDPRMISALMNVSQQPFDLGQRQVEGGPQHRLPLWRQTGELTLDFLPGLERRLLVRFGVSQSSYGYRPETIFIRNPQFHAVRSVTISFSIVAGVSGPLRPVAFAL